MQDMRDIFYFIMAVGNQIKDRRIVLAVGVIQKTFKIIGEFLV